MSPKRRKGSKPVLTSEMLRAAAAAHLGRQGCVLWGRAFNVLDEDRDNAVDWLCEQVVEVLGLVST